MHAIENQYTEFVLDALRDPQKVQVGEQRGHEAVPRL